MIFEVTQKELSTIHRMLGLIEGASFNSPQTAEAIGNAVKTIDKILEAALREALVRALKEREKE